MLVKISELKFLSFDGHASCTVTYVQWFLYFIYTFRRATVVKTTGLENKPLQTTFQPQASSLAEDGNKVFL